MNVDRTKFIVFLLIIAVSGAIATSAAAQSPRLTSGEPDLQGVWDFRTMTPLQRPSEFADRATLTAEEAAAYETRTNSDRDTYDVNRNPSVHAKFWLDNGRSLQPDLRTSLIIEPTNGRIPALTTSGQQRAEARAALRRISPRSHLDRSITERCMVGFNAGPPMNPGAYNNNVLILQVPGYVILHNEMVHEVRVVPMDGRQHVPNTIRQIRGDSRGHWDSDTLVIETTNFRADTSFAGSGEHMRLTERFSRTSEHQLLYEYTITDPDSFVQPWTVAVEMQKTDQPMFEFACHEGNYGLENILNNARAADETQH
tara:strand:- start:3655 stop:4593 length:939 start_codon:yes stop_codon:yes gene_type:complete